MTMIQIVIYFFQRETKEKQRESIKSIDCNYKLDQYWWNQAGRKRYIYTRPQPIYGRANTLAMCPGQAAAGCIRHFIPMCNALPLTRCDRFNGVINAHARGFISSSVGDPLPLRLAPRSIHPAVDTRIRATDVTRRFATISGGEFFFVFFRAREDR